MREREREREMGTEREGEREGDREWGERERERGRGCDGKWEYWGKQIQTMRWVWDEGEIEGKRGRQKHRYVDREKCRVEGWGEERGKHCVRDSESRRRRRRRDAAF